MALTCVIVEDEPLARQLLEQYVLKVPHLVLEKSFANPLEALDYLRDHAVDILFSDIQMPEITGITLLKVLKNKPLIILTTAYSEYAIEGYELDVADYLLKPITFDRFLKAVEKVTQRQSSERTPPEEKAGPEPVSMEAAQPFIFVKDGTKLVKIRLADILYIEGLKDYVTIYLPGKKIVTLQTLKALEAQLPESQFIRIHNSYIVAFEWIEVIHREQVQIGKTMIPVSDTYRKAFREFVERKQA
jgi:two-component system, LytTR family, response regulator